MGLNTPSGGGGAPPDAAYVTGSSNSKLSNETVVAPASDILTSGSLDSVTSLSPGFNTFTQVDANSPALVLVAATTKTDGSTDGRIALQVDKTGNGTRDYSITLARQPAGAGGNATSQQATTVLVPAGGQFKVFNADDPTGSNRIDDVQATVITP